MASVVPDVVNALRALAQAAVPAGTSVSIGVPPGGDIPSKYVAVGYGGDDRPGIVGNVEAYPGENAGMYHSEEFVVWCAVSTASGDQNAPAQMAVTDALYQPIAAAVKADRHLGGLVPNPGYIEVQNYEWTIEDAGEVATVFFEVRVSRRWI